MKNITVCVPDETYRRARVWAAERESSVSRVVAYLLETLPNIKRATRRFPIPDQPVASPNSLAPDPCNLTPAPPAHPPMHTQKHGCETVDPAYPSQINQLAPKNSPDRTNCDPADPFQPTHLQQLPATPSTDS